MVQRSRQQRRLCGPAGNRFVLVRMQHPIAQRRVKVWVSKTIFDIIVKVHMQYVSFLHQKNVRSCHETQLWALSLRGLWIQTWKYSSLKQSFIFTTDFKYRYKKNELFKVLPEDETGKLLLENIINSKKILGLFLFQHIFRTENTLQLLWNLLPFH